MGSDKKANSLNLNQQSVPNQANAGGNKKVSAHAFIEAGTSYSIVGDEKGDAILSKLDEILARAAITLSNAVIHGATEAATATPAWTLTRQGEQYIVHVPSSLDSDDLLSSIIMITASKSPNVAFTTTTAEYSAPTYTNEARKMLAGIITGLHGPPKSFSVNSDPVTIASTSLWAQACSIALSDPQAPKSVKAFVLPSNIGTETARKYLNKINLIVKACGSDLTSVPVTTMDALLKNWCRDQGKTALALVRQQKISWSWVLSKGATWDIIKKRGRPDQKRLKTPAKPNSSPWCSGTESKAIGEIYDADWKAVSEISDRWKKLSAEEQHDSFDIIVREVRDAYSTMYTTSQSINAKLGHRKRHVLAKLETDGCMPRKKEEKSNNFLLGQRFFKLDLTTLSKEAKFEFFPARSLSKDKQEESEAMLVAVELAKQCPNYGLEGLDSSKPRERMIKWWVEKFQPKCDKNDTWIEADHAVATKNRFSLLENVEDNLDNNS